MPLWCSMSTKPNFHVTFKAIPIVSISHIATASGEPRLLYIQLYTCTAQITQHTHTTHRYTTCTKPVTDTYQTCTHMHMTMCITHNCHGTTFNVWHPVLYKRAVSRHKTMTKLLFFVFSFDSNKLNDPIVNENCINSFMIRF